MHRVRYDHAAPWVDWIVVESRSSKIDTAGRLGDDGWLNQCNVSWIVGSNVSVVVIRLDAGRAKRRAPRGS